MLISETNIDVRYAETDQMGVVHHATYIIWFEVGRTELIKELGFNYAEMERDGIIAPVINVNATYKNPLHYGETATIKSWIEKYDGFRVIYGYEILNPEGKVSVSGYTEHICAKKDSLKPIRLKTRYPDWHDAYEKAKKKGEQ